MKKLAAILFFCFAGSLQAQSQSYAPIEWWNVSNWYADPYNGPRYSSYEEAFLSEWIDHWPNEICGQAGAIREWHWDGVEPLMQPGQGGYNFVTGQAYYLLLECNGVPNGVPRQGYPSLAIPYRYCPNSEVTGPFTGGGSQFPDVCPPFPNHILPDSNKGDSCPASPGAKNNFSICGDPINALIGNKFENKVEYQGQGAFPLTFSWYYNSLGAPRASSTLPLGLGEMRVHNYSQFISFGVSSTAAASVFVTRPDGDMILFTKSGLNWVSENPDVGVLTSLLDAQSQTVGWTYQAKNGTLESFNSRGVLVSILNQDGLKQEMFYNVNGLLEKVRDPQGRELSFTYNSQRQINRLNLPDGQYIDFSYDGAKNLANVTYPGGNSIGYRYNESGYSTSYTRSGALTGVIDEKSQRYSSTTYDDSSRATSTYLSSNIDKYIVDFTIPTVPVVTTPLGEKRNLTVAPVLGKAQMTGLSRSCVGCTTTNTSTTFDAAGRADLYSDAAGVVTDTDYDARGLLTQKNRIGQSGGD